MSLLTLLLLAFALAAQPWSVLAAVLLGSSEHGRAKEIAFVAGWLVALVVVAVATLVLYPAEPPTTSKSATLSVVELVAGVVLAVWAVVSWRRPNRPGGSREPKWLGRIDSMSPLPALVFGAFMPNYVLVVAAVTNVLKAGLSQGWTAVVVVVWVAISSLGVVSPLVLPQVRGEDPVAVYQRWRAWLLANGHRLVLGVLGVVGLALMVKGILGLATL